MVGHEGHPGEEHVQENKKIVNAVLQQVVNRNVALQHMNTVSLFACIGNLPAQVVQQYCVLLRVCM